MIISPTSIASDLCCLGYSSFANLDGQNCYLTLHSSNAIEVTFPLQLLHGLLSTQPLQSPMSDSSIDHIPVVASTANTKLTPSALYICHLSKTQLSHLWHQRLGHLNRQNVAIMHRFAKGIPILPVPTDLDSCPVCLASKIHHAARGKTDTRHASQCYQGLSIDFGFFVQ